MAPPGRTKKHDRRFYCSVCKRAMQDSISFSHHNNGKKHKRKLVKSSLERSLQVKRKSPVQTRKGEEMEQRNGYSLAELMKEKQEKEKKAKANHKERKIIMQVTKMKRRALEQVDPQKSHNDF